ncbi:transforming growth factor-beta-induced protein ig-h3-like [Ylistrum balloti]|uniref:transforming growth factor-beta-induced protein ig-h3-like n=1 Tax=Ylistrum balloti TaxID=509963 RepID=UPI002905BDC3|nr:transforming growth factor-beta-induced protein ig-h3-like [Ylistrum balloti]
MSKYVLIVLLALAAVCALTEAHRRQRPTRPGRRVVDRQPRLAWRVRQFMQKFGLDDFSFDVDKPGFQFSINFGGRNDNWWEGPNVCETKTTDEPREDAEEVSLDEESQRHTYGVSELCDVSRTVYKCTKTKSVRGIDTITVLAKKCCNGFTRKPSDFGCPKEVHLQDLNSTAHSLGLQEFLETANNVDLTESLRTGNFTVFAPTDDAFSEFGQVLPPSSGIDLDMGSVLMLSDSMIEDLTDKIAGVMLGHLAVGAIPTSSMYDEQLIETLSPFNSKIRINFYDNTGTRIMLANCQRVTSADNMARNGVIHVVDQVLTPVTKSIIDIISKDPNLSFLKTALGKTALTSSLREDGQFTIYAPTDAAFRKLDRGLLDRLFNRSACLKKVLQDHILPNVICSAAVQGQSRTRTVLNTYLHLTRDEDDKLFVQDHQVVASDIMATNGVIHLVDSVLFLDRVMGVLDVVDNKVPNFTDLVRLAGLEERLQNAEDITIFAPTEKALLGLDPDVLEVLMNDTSALRDVLKYHVVTGVYTTKSFYNDQRLDTLNDDNQIRINKHTKMRRESAGMAQCVPIVSSSARICNGIVHFIDKVLIPPRYSIMQILRRYARFSKFVQLIQQTNLDQTLDEDEPLTVLALTNEAFDNLPRDVADVLQGNDIRQIEKLVYSNVIRRTICCHAIQNWFFMRRSHVWTLNGDVLTVSSKYGKTSVGRATVTECDLTATNGVIQVVDGFAASVKRWDFWWW